MADVPPEVLGATVADVDVDLADQGWCGVGGCEVGEEGTVVGVVHWHCVQAQVIDENAVLQRRWSALRDWKVCLWDEVLGCGVRRRGNVGWHLAVCWEAVFPNCLSIEEVHARGATLLIIVGECNRRAKCRH